MLALVLGAAQSLCAQTRTVGLMEKSAEVAPGYSLFSPMRATTTYLIDNCGEVVHSWDHQLPATNSAYLMEDGSLFRAAGHSWVPGTIPIGGGEYVQRLSWEGDLLWSFRYAESDVRMHHDFAPLPNGNVLILAWEVRDFSECIAAGRDLNKLPDSKLYPETIIEVEPIGQDSGRIVWEWRMWDHLVQEHDSTKANYGVVADHPELIDLNYIAAASNTPGRADWVHANSIAYHAERDEIMLNSREFCEFWVIDHSTTTGEAAGHSGGRAGRGGDLLYRWGNPAAYGRGLTAERQLWGAHHAHWIPEGYPHAGKVMVFNNGAHRAGNFSSVEIIDMPEAVVGYQPDDGQAYGPADPDWQYIAGTPTDFFSPIISGAEMLPNGHVLVCDGVPGTFFEVTPEGQEVWRYVNPDVGDSLLSQGDSLPHVGWAYANAVFRVSRYAQKYPPFLDPNHDLAPKGPIELDPQTIDCHLDVPFVNPPAPTDFAVYPNPVENMLTIRPGEVAVGAEILLYNPLGQVVWSGRNTGEAINIDTQAWRPGVYFLRIGESRRLRILKL